MSFQQWDPSTEPIRPGLYTNFEKAASDQIGGGARGTVAIPLVNYGKDAKEGKFYTVESKSEAAELFGSENIQSIDFALNGGAKDVLVYTMPKPGEDGGSSADFAKMRDEFEARPFNVFVFDGEVDEEEQSATLTWVTKNREEKKHFSFIAGGTAEDDQDPKVADARSEKLDDDYVANLGSGGVISDKEYSSGEFAPYMAGLIASTPINKSITYTSVGIDDVTKRLRNKEIESALEAGTLVLVHDGEKVKVEQGVMTSGDKIRKVSARQAIVTAIEKTARDEYIGVLDNNEAGQMALVSAVKLYLETLENENVLTDIEVGMNPDKESKGDKAYLDVAYTELDSMERVFLTIKAE